jgi:hypothetical protein
MMGCLLVLFAACFPRIATLFIWLARPGYFEVAFGGSWLWPLLGILFLPFTTLMYVLLWSGGGLTAWDWLWLVLAVGLDVSHYGSAGYGGRMHFPQNYTRPIL